MLVRLWNSIRERFYLSRDVKMTLVTVLILMVAGVVMLFIQGAQTQDPCLFIDNVSYEVEHINPPTSYQSDIDKVIWRPHDCGFNLKDMYFVTPMPDSFGKCTVTQIQVDKEPIWILNLPEHYKNYCPEKTPEALEPSP